MKILIGVLMLASSAVSNAKDVIAVEWAPFVKSKGITDQQLIAAADRVNIDFLIKQPGFIKRELIKKDDNEYADVIHWNTKKDAVTAGEKVINCGECIEYFQLMDTQASANAGKGFSHYVILKQW
jgi:hypothetical protein